MNIAVFAYSRRGCETAQQVISYFDAEDVRSFTVERFAQNGFAPIEKPSGPFYGKIFAWADAMVFVGACGIAVREIAPHVHDKCTDPAVISIDELGQFVIPLLSGHIGGANNLALMLAGALGATPVITTATDINRKFSVDAWAARNGFAIGDMHIAKMVSAVILEKPVPLMSDFPIVTELPAGVVAGDSGEVGICLSWEKKEPFEHTLLLAPRVLHLGLGCRRGTPVETIRDAVEAMMMEHRINRRAIKCAASIDLKADESGLLTFCEENQWPITFYSAQELLAVEGEFTASPFVKSVTGVDNVCERSALIGAEKLIVKKTAQNGVTVALAAEPLEVRFG